MYKDFSWENIWNHWKFFCRNNFPELLDSVHFKHILFTFNHDTFRIYGYDWVNKTEFENRIKYVTQDTLNFLYFGEKLNKGTIYTARALVEAKDNSELLAAIWITSYVKDHLNEFPCEWRGNGYRILKQIEAQSLRILKENGVSWHHAMRKLLPEDYFSTLLDKIQMDDYEQMVEMAALNAALILSQYVITLYESQRN